MYRRVALIHPLSQPLSLKLVFPPNPSPFVCVSPTPVDKHGPWPRETQGGDKQSSGFYTVRSFKFLSERTQTESETVAELLTPHSLAVSLRF